MSNERRERSARPESKLVWWKKHGLLVAGGWHPLTGRIRAGGQPENLEEEYDWEYTEEHIRRLKELGITLLVSQFDRGLGDTDQAEDQERAKKQAELCHQYGIRHGCYLANTVYFESVMKDYPDCEDWVTKTYDGRFVHYGGEQSWRWVACFNSPGWRKRMKRQIKKAVTEVKTDLLHFDNLGVWPEPDSCHCHYCQDAFRKFLLKKYPDPASQKKRFGFTGFDTFRAPNFYLRFIQPWDLDRFHNPLMQEWLLFRCWTVTDYIREMSQYARFLNPEIAIDSNGQSIRGVNQALLHGTDHARQAAWVDIVWEENPDYRPDDDPRAIYPVTHKFRGMNLFRHLGKPVITAYRDEESLAFNLTFSGHPGINTRWGYAEPGRKPLSEVQPGVKELLSFYRGHVLLYTTAQTAATIAIWRSRLSLSFVSTWTHLSVCVLEQLLFNQRWPFSIIEDDYLTEEQLRNYRLLILPNCEFVSDEQVKVIIEFVRRGGRLLLTERTGEFNCWGRRRVTFAFQALFEQGGAVSSSKLVETASFDPHTQRRTNFEFGQPLFSTCGQGRAVYLPLIHYVHPPRTFRSRYNVHYDGIDSRYWKEPYNAGEISDAILWLIGEPEFRIFGFPEVRVEYLKWEDGFFGLSLIRCGQIAGPVRIPLAIKSNVCPKDGVFFAPEKAEEETLTWKEVSAGWWETLLPEVSRHALVRWNPKKGE
ncbi:MAG: beta-galactosidase [Candidatus Omnitrophica bacterium]|nr:beta-galactosidase [Candidatus Omnitrophota bacterium]